MPAEIQAGYINGHRQHHVQDFFTLLQKVPHLKSSAFEKGCKLDNLYHVKWVYNPLLNSSLK